MSGTWNGPADTTTVAARIACSPVASRYPSASEHSSLIRTFRWTCARLIVLEHVRGTEPVGHVRIGYARASTARQSLDSQFDSLAEAGVTRVLSEKISTRATKRPELDKAVSRACELRASGVRVTLVVHEHKRLGRGIDLAMLAEELKAHDIGLEFLRHNAMPASLAWQQPRQRG